MRLFTLTLTSLLFFSSNAHANSIEIKVNGMVCDFCAQAIWKVFQKHEEVENIDVNLDEGTVTVNLKPGQTLTDEQLQEGITYSGYDLVSITKIEGGKHDG